MYQDDQMMRNNAAGMMDSSAPAKMEEYDATEPFYDTNPMFAGASAPDAGAPSGGDFKTVPMGGMDFGATSVGGMDFNTVSMDGGSDFSTMPVSGGNGDSNGYSNAFVTTPVSGFGMDTGFNGGTSGMQNSGMQDYNSTLPLNDAQYHGQQPTNSGAFQMDKYDPTAPADFSSYNYSGYEKHGAGAQSAQSVEPIQPVVGWFVAIAGPHKGASFQILPNWNYIGREASNTICIPGDTEISRTNMACVCYDPESMKYYFAAGESKNLVRVNDTAIPPRLSVELWDRDIIRMGKTKLMFVALCNEDFNWNE